MTVAARTEPGYSIAEAAQELGETVAECAVRETLEETGLTVEVPGRA